MERREFLVRSALLAAGAGLSGGACGLAAAGSPPAPAPAARPSPSSNQPAEPVFRISLAQWSLHRTIRAGKLDNLDFARTARERFGLDAVEYVNQFFKDRAQDGAYLAELKRRAADAGVRSLLIMCDGEGALGDRDEGRRRQAVENHVRWLEAARFLGCHSIRVNAESHGSHQEQLRLVADGLRRLCEAAEPHGLDVIVENHGGLSSNAAWLAGVIRRVDHPRAGTLPDFGNFQVRSNPDEWYDRYKGVAELMPFARGVSAKSHEFDTSGNEARTDYRRMLRVVLDAGYRGYVGIEYEGDGLSEDEGIRATKRLLEQVRAELQLRYS